MPGKLIFVSGLSGAGKTTLVGAALANIPELHYVRTVTTRPPRKGETGSFEYDFVSEDEYARRRSASAGWDHTKYMGHEYGADIAAVKTWLEGGQPVICSVAPDLFIINEMQEHYGMKPIKIWINAPVRVAKQRLQDDLDRLSRAETDRVKGDFDFIFEPTGNLAADKREFTRILENVLARN